MSRVKRDVDTGMTKLIKAMNSMSSRLGDGLRNDETEQIMRNQGQTEHADEMRKHRETARRENEEMLKGLFYGKITVPVTYEDPDQTQMTGIPAVIFRNKWGDGMDYRPHDPQIRHLSPWLVDIFLGNFNNFMRHINRLNRKELDRQLQKRETLLQIGAIFHVIIGARTLYEGSPVLPVTIAERGQPEMNHMKIFDKLLELGAGVNVHDSAGYTPLHHCLTSVGNNATLQMARILLKKGANPNAINRFGAPPIIECVITNRPEFVELLVKHGADPSIKEMDGFSALHLARNYPDMLRILKKADQKLIKLERKEAKKESYKRCSGCDNSGEKRCTGCFLEWYCSAECQRSDWAHHKETCKARRTEYVMVEFVDRGYETTFNWQSGRVDTGRMSEAVSDIAASSFVVKIQVSLGGMFGTQNGPSDMMVYNKDRTVKGLISVNNAFGSKLETIIRTQGFQGEKGYFYAMKQKGRIFINPSILPPETW